jgi:REP element-mobilizing transposase RayT
MSRRFRIQSPDNYYHVGTRGVGKQIVYEDDEDRRTFLKVLSSGLEKYGGTVIAWCLMSNHYHLVVQLELDKLSNMMRELNSTHAKNFNMRHGRKGHLFENRFWSEPLCSDNALLAAVRYVHLNPQKARLSAADTYQWSSYHEYLSGEGLAKTSMVLDILGGTDAFTAFHLEDDASSFSEGNRGWVRMSDDSALSLVHEILDVSSIDEILSLPICERNAKLHELKDAGIPCSQLQRLTGIGRYIIAKA